MYFEEKGLDIRLDMNVLVPFYRGAVVFNVLEKKTLEVQGLFSSPFIEERLYFTYFENVATVLAVSSRPLLSRSGCIFTEAQKMSGYGKGSRPLLSRSGCI